MKNSISTALMIATLLAASLPVMMARRPAARPIRIDERDARK